MVDVNSKLNIPIRSSMRIQKMERADSIRSAFIEIVAYNLTRDKGF